MKNNKMNLLCYDTLVMVYKFDDVDEFSNYKKIIAPLLSGCLEEFNHETNQLEMTGNILRMYVTLKNTDVVVAGSLCKSFNGGNNLYGMTKDEIELQIQKLADALKLPIHEAQVTRIDFGCCLLMENSPEEYFASLGNALGKFEIIKHKHSRNYDNSYQSFVFYNKKVEMTKHGQKEIAEKYNNILRYEMRYKRNLAKRFNKEKVQVKDLYNKPFFNDMVERWLNSYKSIHKNLLLSPKLDKLTCNDGVDLTLSNLILLHGANNVNEMASALKGRFRNSTEYSRFNKKLKSLKHLTKESTLESELTAKILDAKDNTLLLNTNAILQEATY